MIVDPLLALDRTVCLIQDYVDADAQSIVARLTATRVRILADDETLSTNTGRAAVVAVFESVARLGVQIILDVPPATQIDLPPGYLQVDVRSALTERASQLVTRVTDTGTPDLCINLARRVKRHDISLGGGDTDVRLRIGQWAGGWHGTLPLGAGLAGTAAGAEVTRLVIRCLLGESQSRERFWLEHRPFDLSLPPVALPSHLDLGTVDFVSSGAITQAVLLLLFLLPGVSLTGRVFDDDAGQQDNLNRYFLLTASGLGVPKARQLASLSTDLVRLEPHLLRVTNSDSIAHLRPLADTVCVGVDSVEARWDVQRLATGWVGVGATTHSLAMASEHRPGEPCSACVHPVTEPPLPRLPTISFVSLMAGTLLAHRLLASRGHPGPWQLTALNLFNLAGRTPLVIDRMAINPSCPLGCGIPSVTAATRRRRPRRR